MDSTCGLQMAYLKRPAPRSLRRLDAAVLAREVDGVDCAYLDPPYNQHSYFPNYHVWETITRWDRPEAYGVARKRVDCRSRRSSFNRSREAWAALTDLVEGLRTSRVIASVNEDGFHDPAELAGLLAARGHVAALAIDVARYVGARIGIHDPAGRRVGTVSHVRTMEWLMMSGPDRAAVERAFDDLPTVATPALRGRR